MHDFRAYIFAKANPPSAARSLCDSWATCTLQCPGSIPGAGHLFRYVTNQPPKANSAVHPSGVGKWVPASAGKAKACMVHSVGSVQVKLWDPLRTRAIPERLRGVFTTRRYTNSRLPLPLPSQSSHHSGWPSQNISPCASARYWFSSRLPGLTANSNKNYRC